MGRLIEGGGLGRPAGKNLQILDRHRLASLKMGTTDDDSKEKGLQQLQTVNRKQHKSCSNGTCFKSCPKYTVEFLTEDSKLQKSGFKKIMQKVVNTFIIPCTENAHDKPCEECPTTNMIRKLTTY